MARLALASCILGLLACAYAAPGYGDGNNHGRDSGNGDSETNQEKGNIGSTTKDIGTGDITHGKTANSAENDGDEGSHQDISGASEKDAGFGINQTAGENSGDKFSNESPKPLESSEGKKSDSDNEHNTMYTSGSSEGGDSGHHDSQKEKKSIDDSNEGDPVKQGGDKAVDNSSGNDGEKGKVGSINEGGNYGADGNQGGEEGQVSEGGKASENDETQVSQGNEKGSSEDRNEEEHDSKGDKRNDGQNETGPGDYNTGNHEGSNYGSSLGSNHGGHNSNSQRGTKVGYGR